MKNKVMYVSLYLLFTISICFGQGGIGNESTVSDIFPASILGEFGEIQINQKYG